MPTKVLKQHLEGRYTKWAILALLLFASVALLGRVLLADKTILGTNDTVWTVTIDANIEASREGERYILSPPWLTSHASIVSQTLQHTGMRQIRVKSENILKRHIVLQVIKPGNINFSAEFNIHHNTTGNPEYNPTAPPPDDKQRLRYLQLNYSEQSAEEKPASITGSLLNSSASDKEIVRKLFFHTSSKDFRTNLQNDAVTPLVRAQTMVSLCRSAGIPSRVVTGFILQDTSDPGPHHWVEAYYEEKWHFFDPDKGLAEIIPDNYVPFSRGNTSIIRSEHIDKANVSYTLERNYDLDSLNIRTDKRITDIFNLQRFAPDTRNTLSLLLLLPLGVLLTAICRSLLGIRAYGTFTPALLALAAIYADWAAALVLLFIVVALGLSGRSAMPDQLTRIPRMAIMFTIVVMSMVLGVSMMDYFRINPGEHVFLLPIVILTTLIDRFYSTADESGNYIAMRRMLWTIIIGLLCYPILKLNSLGTILLAYPELHFLTLAVILMITVYNGKKLCDIPLFKWIKEPVRKTANKSKSEEPEAL
jgi:hypothetical protein